MKILIIGNFHHNNMEGLKNILYFLKYDYYFTTTYYIRNIINNYDIIISPCQPVDTSKYPGKKFIFGPHFSVFPTNKLLEINNVHKNSVYIQPSKWAMNMELFNVEQITPLKIQFFQLILKVYTH